MPKEHNFSIFKVEEQLSIELLAGPEQERFQFRIEILKCMNSGRVTALVYRQDSFQLKLLDSLAMEPPLDVAHHELWVVDDFFSAQNFSGESIDDVREMVIKSIKHTFFPE